MSKPTGQSGKEAKKGHFLHFFPEKFASFEKSAYLCTVK